eukprot:768436-Hanusia_phi.AAC.6
MARGYKDPTTHQGVTPCVNSRNQGVGTCNLNNRPVNRSRNMGVLIVHMKGWWVVGIRLFGEGVGGRRGVVERALALSRVGGHPFYSLLTPPPCTAGSATSSPTSWDDHR